MRTRTGFKYAGFGVLGVAAVFGFTLVVMLLWNALVPELFNGPELGYWQTLGLLVLSKILFSGIGGGGIGVGVGWFPLEEVTALHPAVATTMAVRITATVGRTRENISDSPQMLY